MWHLKPYEYSTAEPWRLTKTERIGELKRMSESGVKVVVYIYEQADTSTFRYRVYNMCEVLGASPEWHGVYFFKNELAALRDYFDRINVIIIARYRWDFALQDFIDEAKLHKIPVVFDCDDLVYDHRYVPLVTNTMAVDMNDEGSNDYWFTYTGRLRQTMLCCDASISTNSYLSEMMENDSGKPCYVIPNFFNRLQRDASEFYCIQKRNDGQKDGTFAVGYFSGSPSHLFDFMTAAPELASLLDECPDMMLVIVGFMELPDFMLKYRSAGRIRQIPLLNFIDLQKIEAEVDVNIIPLQDNRFTNCKSELKFFEAGICGTVSVAAPTYVFRHCIKDGENGWLCRHGGGYYERLKSLYEGGIDLQIKENAKSSSYDGYLYRNQLDRIEDTLNRILDG